MKKIVICGPMKFRNIMIREQYDLALEGNLVLLPTLCPENVKLEPEEIKKLVDLHKEKIRIADEVYIINEDNYMGEDTIEELIFATRCGIPIRFYKWQRLFNYTKTVRSPHDHTDALNNARGLSYEV